MKNQIDKIRYPLAYEIKTYGITEVFIRDGELHTTSDYTLPYPIIKMIERELGITTK